MAGIAGWLGGDLRLQLFRTLALFWSLGLAFDKKGRPKAILAGQAL